MIKKTSIINFSNLYKNVYDRNTVNENVLTINTIIRSIFKVALTKTLGWRQFVEQTTLRKQSNMRVKSFCLAFFYFIFIFIYLFFQIFKIHFFFHLLVL